MATVFAGSPQLLGTVKLCSGSAVASLPLYSDFSQLKRTENVSDSNNSVFPLNKEAVCVAIN